MITTLLQVSGNSSNDLLVVGIITLLVWAIILSFVISSATRQSAHIKNEENIIRLLMLIAAKIGVDGKDIKDNVNS
jgi:threonine/homoserine/homoserine lactone efflux protein